MKTVLENVSVTLRSLGSCFMGNDNFIYTNEEEKSLPTLTVSPSVCTCPLPSFCPFYIPSFVLRHDHVFVVAGTTPPRFQKVISG